MAVKHRLVRFNRFENKIQFPVKISNAIIHEYAGAINEWRKRGAIDFLTLDFSGVQRAFSNGMLGIIASVNLLRQRGYHVNIKLPNDANVVRLFKATNWAYFLDPAFPESTSIHKRHLITRQFKDYKQIAAFVNDFMKVVLENIVIEKRDIISALEWSINEICDNVINHSESTVGGFVQVITSMEEGTVSFTVADAGKGIFNTLKQGLPHLKDDSEAIGEAIKVGVTRSKEVGQGNGLAGTLRITTMSGGSIEISSGSGRFYSTQHTMQPLPAEKNQSFSGTIVSGVIRKNNNFSISSALQFDSTKPYIPLDIIEMAYEDSNDDILHLNLKDETTGFGTRNSGKGMRFKTLNLINSSPGYIISIDWSGIPLISSSFADEFIAKLLVQIGRDKFKQVIRNINTEPLVRQLLDKAITQRLAQQK